ncbi:MAG: hypothetical protein KIS80_02125 [Anaerolineales bacterium]|nr:hypothetical protein [Anaerolineales bacterium]
MSQSNQGRPLEIRFGYLVPFFLVLGALLNLAITQPPHLRLGRVSGVSIKAGYSANYGRSMPGLNFPAIDPGIMEEAQRDAEAGGFSPSETPNLAAATATATPLPPDQPTATSGSVLPVVPTLVGAIPTVVGVIPTVAGVVPTVIGVVPTVINVVPTVVNVIPTVGGIIPTLLPGLPPLLP